MALAMLTIPCAGGIGKYLSADHSPLFLGWAQYAAGAAFIVPTALVAGIAEFERALILGRTSAGREAAKQRGVRFGRPPALTPDHVALGHRLVDKGTSVRAAAKVLRCHYATLYRALDATAAAGPG